MLMTYNVKLSRKLKCYLLEIRKMKPLQKTRQSGLCRGKPSNAKDIMRTVKTKYKNNYSNWWKNEEKW